MGAYIIARGVTSPLLGRLVDRNGQTVVLIACATTSAALLIAVALLPHSPPVSVVVGLCGAIGTVSPPLAACIRALLPVIVSDPIALDAAYTLEATALELTFIAGPPFALPLATGISSRAPLPAGSIILLRATVCFAAQPASRHWQGHGRPAREPVRCARRRSGSSCSSWWLSVACSGPSIWRSPRAPAATTPSAPPDRCSESGASDRCSAGSSPLASTPASTARVG